MVPVYSILRYFATKARENAEIKKEFLLFFYKKRKEEIILKRGNCDLYLCFHRKEVLLALLFPGCR